MNIKTPCLIKIGEGEDKRAAHIMIEHHCNMNCTVKKCEWYQTWIALNHIIHYNSQGIILEEKIEDLQ
jgi:hypothetical protein